jgi:hypothetical protein
VDKNTEFSDRVGYYIRYDIDTLKEESGAELHFENVIIKFFEDTWRGKPSMIGGGWFNKVDPAKKSLIEGHCGYLPFLNTRKYIKIIDPFMKVEISSKKKGAPITIEDVLFASRALAMNGWRTIGTFKILKNDGVNLVLEPQTDNYST